MTTHKQFVLAGHYGQIHPEIWDTEDIDYYIHTPQETQANVFSGAASSPAGEHNPVGFHSPHEGNNREDALPSRYIVITCPSPHTDHYRQELARKIWREWLNRRGE